MSAEDWATETVQKRQTMVGERDVKRKKILARKLTFKLTGKGGRGKRKDGKSAEEGTRSSIRGRCSSLLHLHTCTAQPLDRTCSLSRMMEPQNL